ncbi:hypothetical protein C8Q75DRAFT_780669 [Abortiporus biennis]|nr:hypothetical protein C8Q75DRAFT_780669 [Abortiporus biennis]
MNKGHQSYFHLPEDFTAPPMSKFVEILKQCSNLVHLTVDHAGPRLPPDQEYPAPETTIYLPKLRSLTVGSDNPENTAYLLAVLTYPKGVKLSIDCSDSTKREATFPFILPLMEHRPCINEIVEKSDAVVLSICNAEWTIACGSRSYSSSQSGAMLIKTHELNRCDDRVVLDFFVEALLPIFGNVAITLLQVNCGIYLGIELWTELLSSFPKLKILWCDFGKAGSTRPDSDVILEALSRPSSQGAFPCLHLESLQILYTNLCCNDPMSCLEARDANNALRLKLLQYGDVFFTDDGSEDDDAEKRLTKDNLPDLSRFVDKFEVSTRERWLHG